MRDALVRHFAEAGVDAIHRGLAVGGALHQLRAGGDAGGGGRVQCQLPGPGDRSAQIAKRQQARAYQHQFGWMPTCLITAVHLTDSDLMNAPSSSGVLPMVKAPMSS